MHKHVEVYRTYEDVHSIELNLKAVGIEKVRPKAIESTYYPINGKA